MHYFHEPDQISTYGSLYTFQRVNVISVEEANLARETAQSKIVELETIISELQTETQSSLLEEREIGRKREEECMAVKYELMRRGERYQLLRYV